MFLREIHHGFLSMCFYVFLFFNFTLTCVNVSLRNLVTEALSRVFILFTVLECLVEKSGIGNRRVHASVFVRKRRRGIIFFFCALDNKIITVIENNEKHFIYTRVVWDRTQISEKTCEIVSRPRLDPLPVTR